MPDGRGGSRGLSSGRLATNIGGKKSTRAHIGFGGTNTGHKTERFNDRSKKLRGRNPDATRESDKVKPYVATPSPTTTNPRGLGSSKTVKVTRPDAGTPVNKTTKPSNRGQNRNTKASPVSQTSPHKQVSKRRRRTRKSTVATDPFNFLNIGRTGYKKGGKVEEMKKAKPC
jgi:cytoskeletal protein RodZ